MCLLAFYINPEANSNEFYLILINVRDEIYNRPTQLASFWENHPQIIGGMDLEPSKKGGTWLAMSKSGKIGALLNILQPDKDILPNKKGRGFLAVDYLLEEKDSLSFLKDISNTKEDYNGFLLVTLDFRSFRNPFLAYVGNLAPSSPVVLQPGIHSFGNSRYPDKPWKKSITVKERFFEIVNQYKHISQQNDLVKSLFQLLNDQTHYGVDENMKKQGEGKPNSFLQKLSSIFVEIPEDNYGSRCHTIILIDGQGHVNYYENSRKENTPSSEKELWNENHFTFKLES